ERITTREIVWEQRVTDHLQVTGSFFHNRVRDLITQRSGSDESLDGLYFQNGGGLRATGAEVEVQTILPGRGHVRGADAVQRSRVDVTDEAISNSPAQVAFLVLDTPVGHTGVTVGVNTWHISRRTSVTGALVPSSTVSDLTVSQTPAHRKLAFSVAFHNLFN